jgi:hypothetical protein
VQVVKEDFELTDSTWHYGSLDGKTESSIIPICHTTSGRADSWKKHTIRTSLGAPCKASMKDYLHVELAFASTVHKTQGKTLSTVVIALEERPSGMPALTYTHLFVALSRVRRASDIRILLKLPNDRSRLMYIAKLKPSVDNKAFFQGFSLSKDNWSATCAESNAESSSVKPQASQQSRQHHNNS